MNALAGVRVAAPLAGSGNGFPVSQPSRPHGRIADIEVLRAFAVSMVLFEHMPINLVFWKSEALFGLNAFFRGWVGVDLFFAISGFVIARGLLPMLVPQTGTDGFVLHTMRFWIRRAWRLFPTAWVWLLIPLVLCLVWNRSGALYSFRVNFAALVAGMLDVQNFRVGTLFGSRPIGVAFPYWSLSLEEQFYLLLPVAIFLFRRWIALPLLGLVVLQFSCPMTPMGMMVRPGAISLGVLLALWEGSATHRMMAPRILGRSRSVRSVTIGLLLLLLMAVGSDDIFISDRKVGLVAVLSGVLVWIASYGGDYVWGDGRVRRVLLWLAARSYAIYVIHAAVFLCFHEGWSRYRPYAAPGRLAAVLFVGAALASVLLLAWLNDRLYADRLRRFGAGVAARFGADGCGREAACVRTGAEAT